MRNTSFFASQRVLVIAGVLLLHALALWALQSGLLQRAVVLAQELVTPVSVITESLPTAKPEPVAPRVPPRVAPPPKPAPQPVAPLPEPLVAAATQVATEPQSAAAPLAVAAAPAANAPQGGLQTAPAAAATAPPAAPAPAARLELPSSRAAYLSNPAPAYPSMSRRLNEQGTVVLDVLVAADGRAKEVKIKTSSGFARLDRAARDAVLGWTFVPGKRAGVAEEMWHELPMPFRLTD